MSVSYQQQQRHTMAQDDLVALFTRSLTLNVDMAAQLAASIENPNMPVPTQPIYASRHYTPSTSTPTAAAATAAARAPTFHLSNEARLRAYGINPNSLSPSQMQLFRIADDAQQARLLDLWKIVPPSIPGEDPSHAWTTTTVETEEHRAIQRFAALVNQKQQQQEQQQQEQQQQAGQHMDEDMAMDNAADRQMQEEAQAQQQAQVRAGYAVQSATGAWINTDADPFAEDGCGGSCAPEPYMVSGYEDYMDMQPQQTHTQTHTQTQTQAQSFNQHQRSPSDGSVKSVVYSHYGAGEVTYRPAAFDRVYASADFYRMDMMH